MPNRKRKSSYLDQSSELEFFRVAMTSLGNLYIDKINCNFSPNQFFSLKFIAHLSLSRECPVPWFS